MMTMNEVGALERQADAAASSGRYGAAREFLEQAAASDQGNLGVWIKLSAMRKAAGDLQGALAAIDQALAISPVELAARLSRAVILDQIGDPDAGPAYRQAVEQLGTSPVPPELEGAAAYARRRSEEFRAALERYLAEQLPAELTPEEAARAERMISNRSRRTRHYHQEPHDFQFPGMPEIEFHDPKLFPGLKALEQATDVIRAEFEALIAAEAAEMVPYVQYPDRVPLLQWKELNNNPRWTAIHLLQNGFPVQVNARHCPRTMEALARMDQPHVPGASPVAMFSMLAPRTRIPAHTGVTNTRLVCHLPLIVPPDCGFRTGATTREWRVGEAFVFDDTIEHEAWNDSDELRVVLIFDLWAPTLTQGDRQAAAAVIGATNANYLAKRRAEEPS